MSQHYEESDTYSTADYSMDSRTASPGFDSTSVASTDVPDISLDMDGVNQMVSTMKHTLASLGVTYDSLGESKARATLLGPALDQWHRLQKRSREIERLDRAQEEEINQLNVLIRNTLLQSIMDHIAGHVNKHVERIMETEVPLLVKQELAAALPESLLNDVHEHKKELQQVQRALYNSEARLANSLIRSHNIYDALQPLKKKDGSISPHFPPDVPALLAVDDATAKNLLAEYDLPSKEETRERSLTKFLAFCGVHYQSLPTAELLTYGSDASP
ncbi:hypothetical protein BOTBODRAFT_27619 [Botryobasidium botryosum FD-172 SS1]|uniref:Uncharacterized protein n=1 Tax=Botryobasidium botryosum (strain FD-172 SS1) TaxID=930990 RepID=A0A067N8U8_BOTB1|nr:hypothetical protein BOTBODRAFT_27619 [Botryobasidium botryosum FD-172 SS1]